MNIQGINQINEKAWREYRSRLLQFIRSRVNDPDAAEDILQEVLLKIWTRRSTLKQQEQLLPWMYRIARNGVIDYYRDRKRIPISPSDFADDPSGDSSEEEETFREHDSAERELAECIHPMVDTLPDHYRRALALVDISGLSQIELAEEEGISVSGAKSRVQRGRAMLKEMIVECCRLEFDVRGRIVDYSARTCAGSNCESDA